MWVLVSIEGLYSTAYRLCSNIRSLPPSVPSLTKRWCMSLKKKYESELKTILHFIELARTDILFELKRSGGSEMPPSVRAAIIRDACGQAFINAQHYENRAERDIEVDHDL